MSPNHEPGKFSHDTVERKVHWLGIWIVIVIAVGGLVEIVPLYLSNEVTTAAPGVKPYAALALEGRDIYIREGCYNCHSQMIRPLRAETERYGHFSLAGESVYDHPFQFGSKRTGPDLARVGGRYSDEWHRAHLVNPRDVVPESNMPAYGWLVEATVHEDGTASKMRALRSIGVPYSDEDILAAADVVRGKTEMEALIAYLQGLGKASANW
jgi:cytochrome c oxidase cbb3-type subunit II